MHAVVVNVTLNDVAAAQAELSDVVPRVSAAPGFVAAYWIALSAGKGTSVVVFDSEASAQTLVAMIEGTPPTSVTLESIELGQVIAHA